MKLVKTLKTMAAISLLLIIFYGCPFIYPERKYPTGHFPDSISNLEQVNSTYDDINMDLPYEFCNALILFSSNRNTQGGKFDLVTELIPFAWDQIDGGLSIDQNAYELDPFIAEMAKASVTSANEYGPFFFSKTIKPNKGYTYQKYFLLYSDDASGKQDVRFFELERKYNSQLTNEFVDSLRNEKNTIHFLSNPAFNEGYVSIQTNLYTEYNPYYTNEDNDIKSIFYCNDSLGHYDIMSIDIPKGMAIDSFLHLQTEVEKINVARLNSPHNDRCPFVNRNFIVFSSNRPGGLGGYDFYYSTYTNGEWSEPVNFGSPINSEYDEFRAITIKTYGFDNQLMIFSSNRPGGKGGFDIYYTGIDKMPE